MNVLIVGPTWVGDTVLATPVLANLRAALPDAKIYYLSTAWAGDILIDHPDVDELRLRPGHATLRQRPNPGVRGGPAGVRVDVFA